MEGEKDTKDVKYKRKETYVWLAMAICIISTERSPWSPKASSGKSYFLHCCTYRNGKADSCRRPWQ